MAMKIEDDIALNVLECITLTLLEVDESINLLDKSLHYLHFELIPGRSFSLVGTLQSVYQWDISISSLASIHRMDTGTSGNLN